VAAPIVFLSDFGLQDEFVGICHGVIARLAPDARVIDLSHGVPPGDVLRGALLLAACLPYVPAGAVLLGVVDPGVGGSRRPVAARSVDGRLLVGPDNGLLSLAWGAAGGLEAAVRIDADDVVLRPTSSTFHGRDVFAPTAARLAAGAGLSSVGSPIPAATLDVVRVPPAEPSHGSVAAAVVSVDRFGNVALAMGQDDLDAAGFSRETALEVRTATRVAPARPAATFGDVAPGRLAVLIDSAGWVAVVRNGGSAAELIGALPGDRVEIRAAGSRGAAGSERRSPAGA